MSLSVVVTGPRGTGKSQLISELGRSTLVASSTSTSTSGGTSSKRSTTEHELHVKNKYFDVALKLREVRLSNTDDLDDLLFSNPNTAGAILVVRATDSPKSVDWSIFSPKLAFRLVLCRTGGDFEPEAEGKLADTRSRNAKTQAWYDASVMHGFEYVDYDWETDANSSPRPGVEKFGLLSEEVEGSERVVQVLFGSNYQPFSPVDKNSSFDVVTRNKTTEPNPNTVLVLAVSVDAAESLLKRVFPDLVRVKSSNTYDPKDPAATNSAVASGLAPPPKPDSKSHASVSSISGTSLTCTLETKYYCLQNGLTFRVVNQFAMSSSMRDMLVLGYQSYRAMLVIVQGRDHLPQLSGYVNEIQQQYGALFSEEVGGAEGVEKYLLLDTAQCPTNSPLVSQWSENNGYEVVEIPASDDGKMFDQELGHQGLARVKEVMGLVPWDLSANSAYKKAPTKGNDLPSVGERFGVPNTEEDKVATKKKKEPHPSEGVVVVAVGGAESDQVKTAFAAAFGEGVDFPSSSGETSELKLKTKYYSCTVPLFYHQIGGMTAASQLKNKLNSAHTLLLFVDSNNVESVNLSYDICNEVLSEERLALSEDGIVEGNSSVTAVISTSGTPSGAAGGVEEDNNNNSTHGGKFWDDRFGSVIEEGWFVEIFDSKTEPERLKELIESTRWNDVEPKRRSATTTTTTTTAGGNDKKKSSSLDWDKVQGCIPPKDFHMDPDTLITSKLPPKMSFEQLTKRIDLVKKHGDDLPPPERRRQAAYLATLMGEAVDIEDDPTN